MNDFHDFDPLKSQRVRRCERASHACWHHHLSILPVMCLLRRICIGLLLAAFWAPRASSQGPMPEEGATLFPHGAFLSFNSNITFNHREPGAAADSMGLQQPTLVHEMPIVASWSPRRDVQLTATAPLVDKRLDLPSRELSVVGLGDAQLQVKYRFLRRDSERGTTQASIEVAAKLPTGSNDEHDDVGNLISPMLQPGTGSLDWRFKFTATYTGLLGLRRLVADVALARLLRTENNRGLDMGDNTEARLWIHFRPLQTRLVGGEWFVGPDFYWKQRQPVQVHGVAQSQTGSDILTAGLTTYISPRAGLVFWASANFPVAQDWNGAPYEQRHRVSFGVTKQFVVGR